MSRNQALLAILLGAALGSLSCIGLVHADLALSARYYSPVAGFYLDSRWWVQAVYQGMPWAVRVYVVVLLWVLMRTLIAATPQWRQRRGPVCFLLLALMIGPGLITNVLLKPNWGRPRPVQITQFGGTEQYVPPLIPSHQHGHSFPSGHAATAFYLMSLGWVFRRRRRLWLTLGVLAGIGVGYVRIVQGGHFLSDVIFAFVVIWLTNSLLGRWMQSRGWLPSPATG